MPKAGTSPATDPGARWLSILMVINGLDFGGTETALSQLALRLTTRGHEVCVLSLKSIARLGRQLQERGVRVETLGMGESVGVAGAVRAMWRLARMLSDERFDVVHSFLPRANILSRVANRLSAGRTAHISSERSTDFQRSTIVRALNGYTARWTDRILAVSPIVRDVLVERERLSPQKIDILDNGLDLDELDDVPTTDVHGALGLPRDATLVCSVGRLVRDKGHVYLVRALAPLREKWPGLHLVLVGDGPEAVRIGEEARRHGLQDRVHLLGFRSDVIGIVKGVDIFCLPSLEEGTPITVLEAMGCARPVVATDVGGVANLVTPGTTGILVPPAETWRTMGHPGADGATSEANVQLLTNAIDTMMADVGERRRLAENGRRLIEERYTLDGVLTRLEGHYRSLVADEGRVATGRGR